MVNSRIPIHPQFTPPLEPEYYPAALFNRTYRAEIKRSGHSQPLVLGIERNADSISR